MILCNQLDYSTFSKVLGVFSVYAITFMATVHLTSIYYRVTGNQELRVAPYLCKVN